MIIWKTSLLDPPWEERGAGKIKRGAQRHYDLLKTTAMPGVIRASGLWTPGENAHVYCWVTNNFLPDGLWLLNELGVRYITNVAWTKKRPGIGRYFRGKHELLLFGTIGRGWAVRTAPNDIESALDTDEADGDSYFPDGDSIEAEHEMENGKRKHSAKPKVFYDMIESRSQGPYVEFFARSLRPEWTSWGNDAAVVASAMEISQTAPESPTEPEPPPKKTRAKKTAAISPPTDEDRRSMAESGGIAERDLPSGAAEAAQALREQGEEPVLDPEDVFDPNAPAEVREKAWDVFADHAGQLGTKPIPVGEGILETLDALGVPHQEGPRQMFKVEVSDAPLPALTGPGVVEQLEASFAHTQTEGYLAAIAEPKLDGMFMTGPLPGDPSKRLHWADPNVKLVTPPRPPSCPHNELRSICVLCRARR